MRNGFLSIRKLFYLFKSMIANPAYKTADPYLFAQEFVELLSSHLDNTLNHEKWSMEHFLSLVIGFQASTLVNSSKYFQVEHCGSTKIKRNFNSIKLIFELKKRYYEYVKFLEKKTSLKAMLPIEWLEVAQDTMGKVIGNKPEFSDIASDSHIEVNKIMASHIRWSYYWSCPLKPNHLTNFS